MDLRCNNGDLVCSQLAPVHGANFYSCQALLKFGGCGEILVIYEVADLEILVDHVRVHDGYERDIAAIT
jgi:hypothetical protein